MIIFFGAFQMNKTAMSVIWILLSTNYMNRTVDDRVARSDVLDLIR